MDPFSQRTSQKEIEQDEHQKNTSKVQEVQGNGVLHFETLRVLLFQSDIDGAFQLVFNKGNEGMLSYMMSCLKPVEACEMLSMPTMAKLAHVLVLLICKAPLGAPAQEACRWLDVLFQKAVPHDLLDLAAFSLLSDALLCLSGRTGRSAVLAARLHAQLACSYRRPRDPFANTY